MSDWELEAVPLTVIAAGAPVAQRVAFIRRVFAHLTGAVLVFVGIEWILLRTGVAEGIASAVAFQGGGVLGE